ncbi:MAG: hypothetical protein ACYS32_11455, partial [Planctomycetota bacterium]
MDIENVYWFFSLIFNFPPSSLISHRLTVKPFNRPLIGSDRITRHAQIQMRRVLRLNLQHLPTTRPLFH